MKRRFVMVAVAILLLVAVVGFAGYLGFASSRPASTAPQAPPTLAVARGDVAQVVSAPGQLVAQRETLLSLGAAGRLSKIAVRPGDHVKAGQVLAALDDRDLQFALQTARANLASAQAKLNQVKAPPASADVAAAQAQVAGAQAAYDAAASKNAHNADQVTVAKTQLDKATIAMQTAQSAYDRVAWRSDIGMLPQSAALQQATIDYQSALANYNLTLTGINDSAVKSAAQALLQAQANLTKLTAPPSTDEIAVAQAAVDQAQVAFSQAETRLAMAQLTAPFDGIVQDVKAKEGDTVSAGTGLVQLSDPRSIAARVTVVEEDYPLTRVGQTVELYFDARPEVSAHGHVTHVVPLRDPGANPIYPVYVALDEIPDGLAPGMTVDATILVSKQSNVLRLPRSLAQARSDGSAVVKVWTGSKVVDRTVQVGLRGNQYVEIVSGLREGEAVVSR